MTSNHIQRRAGGSACRCRPCVPAFSLVELLTVVFIISLLIGILIPSINAARTAAKKVTTGQTIKSVELGLELFKNDNGPDFRQTNGYPPSFAHPRIPGYDTFNNHAYEGWFPFLPGEGDSPSATPVVYGAHWLPAMLMGVDNLGYVKRSNVPNQDGLRAKPWRWYTPDAVDDGDNGKAIKRMNPYVNPDDVPTLATEKLPGLPPNVSGGEGEELFPDWDEMKHLPVIVDAFDQPILYYVANTHGQEQNMLEDKRDKDGTYGEGPQREGIPYYFHQDNEGFTGVEGTPGWDFGNPKKEHAIATSGAEAHASALINANNRETFARYIVDRKIYSGITETTERNFPLRPVNADTFLLISAGPDGRYGTSDDVSNLPPWTE